MFNSADIQSIRNAKDNDTLTVFIGAGFSKFAETDTIKFPSWEELMMPFKKDLQTTETDYLKVAQLYAIEFGEYRLYEKLKDIIPLHANPSDLHIQLFRLQPRYIITTNFDNLLEKTINEQGLIYDIIKSDEDFVKSNLPQKLIKIHGDLDSHNIVFKEDDYLNYANNRPLLDNFLRHILSSTTVLFLGYSYSDNNIKQISKWIEKQSKVSPPRLMLKLEENKSEIKYLHNHHIRVIHPKNNEKLDFKSLYENFFQSVRIENVNFNDDSLAIDYFYNNLKGLAELNALFPEQILSLFTNCTIKYYKDYFGLWFHQPNGVMTRDYDKLTRELYSRFFEIFKQVRYDKKHKFRYKMDFIVTCFLLANINFIQHNENEVINIYQEYFNDAIPKKLSLRNNRFDDFILFSNTTPKNIDIGFRFVENNHNKFDEMYLALDELDKEILFNKKSKNFLLTMLSQFNYNNLLEHLKQYSYCYNDEYKDMEQKFRRFFNNENINIDIFNYSVKDRKYTIPLYEFVNFKMIYKLHYYSILDNQEKIKNANNNKNGGFSSYDKEYRSNAYCLMLLHFIAGNNIAIDNYTELLNLMKSYMSGKIEVQHINEHFSFQNHELFILIKYFKFKELLDLIYTKILPFVKDESQEGRGENIINFDNSQKEYLKKTLDNLLVLFKKYSHGFYANTISDSFINLILIISLVKWDDSELREIIAKINDAFVGDNYPYDFVKSIDKFVLINYKLYKTQSNEFFNFIDTVLLKFTQGKLWSLIRGNVKDEITHIYDYGYISSEKYSNVEIVEKSIKYIKLHFDYNENHQRELAQLFLANLINISTDEIKEKITNFIQEIRVQNWDEIESNNYGEIFIELDFLQYDLSMNDEFISFLSNWIKNLNKDTTIDINLLKKGGIEQIQRYFEFLIKHKGLTQFESLLQELKNKNQELYNT